MSTENRAGTGQKGFRPEIGVAADIGAFEQQAAADPDLIFKDAFED